MLHATSAGDAVRARSRLRSLQACIFCLRDQALRRPIPRGVLSLTAGLRNLLRMLEELVFRGHWVAFRDATEHAKKVSVV